MLRETGHARSRSPIVILATGRCGCLCGLPALPRAGISATAAACYTGAERSAGHQSGVLEPRTWTSTSGSRGSRLESREIFAARREVLAACQLKPGSRVADVGAGTGLYSRLFADAVGRYGLGLRGRYLAGLRAAHYASRPSADGLTNLTAVLCSERSVTLPPARLTSRSCAIRITTSNIPKPRWPASTGHLRMAVVWW